MSDENYVLQITYQGIDPRGLTVMLNVRGATPKAFDENMAHVQAKIAALKPLPIKQFGGGNNAKKQNVLLPNAPKCKAHPDKTLDVREWKNDEGKIIYFWTCHEKTADGQYCREKNGSPSPEQIIEWKKLNGISEPAAQTDPSICKLHGNIKMGMSSTGVYFHKLETGEYCNGVTVKPAKAQA